MLKNMKNFHQKTMKKTKKMYYQNKLKNPKYRWRTIRHSKASEDKNLNHAVVNNKEITSPKELATEYMNHLVSKITKIMSPCPQVQSQRKRSSKN